MTEPEAPPQESRIGFFDIVAWLIVPVIVIITVLAFARGADPADESSVQAPCWDQTVAASEVATLRVSLATGDGTCLTDEPTLSALSAAGPVFALTLQYTNISPDVEKGVRLRVSLPELFEPAPGDVTAVVVSGDDTERVAAGDIWEPGFTVPELERSGTVTLSADVRVVDQVRPDRDDVISLIRIGGGPNGEDPLSDVIVVEWDVPEPTG